MAAVLKEADFSGDKQAPPVVAGGLGKTVLKRVYTGNGTCIGWGAIAEYLGVSKDSAIRWEKHQRLPVCRLPDGRVMTTLSLIDQWVMARIEAQRAERDA